MDVFSVDAKKLWCPTHKHRSALYAREVIDALGRLVDRLVQVFSLRARRAAAEIDVLRPLVQSARDFFNEVVAQGGMDAPDYLPRWRPIEARLDEVVVQDQRLQHLIRALRACGHDAWSSSPPLGAEDGRKRRGVVSDKCREGEKHALDALRRMSELRAKAQQ